MADWTIAQLEAHLESEMHHGKPGLSAAKKQALVRALRPDARHWIPILAESPVPGAREVAASLIGPLWHDSQELDAVVFRLAQDPHWEVREWAAGPLVDRYLADAEGSWALFCDWADHAPDEVKRALAVAIKSLAHSNHVSPDALLKIADRLVRFENDYLRKNLGPFAIGDGLLPLYPEPTLSHLARWARSQQWAARWNAAAAFTAKKAAPWIETAQDILASLTGDQHPLVRRVAARVLKSAAPKNL